MRIKGIILTTTQDVSPNTWDSHMLLQRSRESLLYYHKEDREVSFITIQEIGDYPIECRVLQCAVVSSANGSAQMTAETRKNI